MALNHVQDQIFALLIQQEEMISELYEIFFRQFPQHASFWKELSLAEVQHVKLLKKLKEATVKEQIVFNHNSVTLNTLNSYLIRLHDVLKKARNGEFTLQTALSCAVDYESSLVERKIFSFFDSPNEKFKETLATLQSDTEKHVEFIRNIQRSVGKMSH